MNSIEKIKFGDQPFDLVPDGVKLGETGGTVTFQKGPASFDSIKVLLKTNGEITQINLSNKQDWSFLTAPYVISNLIKYVNYY